MSDSDLYRNPYVGPRALSYGEKIYGRAKETRQLFDLLIAERIVLLYSPSGAGKTSLIQAALTPALEAEEFQILPVVRVSRGVADGFGSENSHVLSTLLSLEEGVPPEKAIPRKRLATMQLSEYLGKREKWSGNSEASVLIFDQFEEILTCEPLNHAAKVDFFNQVGTALRDLRRWALFAMREDHVAALDPYLRPIPTRLKTTFRLDLLNTENARLAVQQPAREQDVDFTDDATTKLVDDLRQVYVRGSTGVLEQRLGPYVEPVQLQVVCYRLWEKLDANVKRITAEQVGGATDVDSALANYYAERVRKIAESTRVPERLIREWFERRLITESGFRSQVMQDVEGSQGLSNATIRELQEVYLVRGEERRGVIWLELAHDRLVKPILSDNAAWSKRHLSVLQHQAAMWHNQGRPDALCLRAEALDEAQQWAARHSDELTEVDRHFLEVCKRNHDARQSKRLVRYLWASSAVLGCMVILAGVAFWQWNVATQERKKATASSIALRALQLADERLDLSLLLAAEAQEISDLLDTRDSLLTVAYSNPRLITFLHNPQVRSKPGSPVDATAFSPDGALLATGDYSGCIGLWDIADLHKVNGPFDFVGVKEHRPKGILDSLVTDAVRSIAFSPDKRYLAISSKDGTIAVCDLLNEHDVVRLAPSSAVFSSGQEKPANIWSIAFSPDSALLASGDSLGRIRVWDVVHKVWLDFPQLPLTTHVRSVAFHPRAWPFAPTDFPNLPALIARLASATDKPSSQLWSRFPEAVRVTLTDPTKLPSDNAALFIKELNKIVLDGSLGDDERFSEVSLSDTTRAAKSAKPPPGLTSRLNRLLVEDILAPDVLKQYDLPTILAAGCSDGSIILWSREGSRWIGSKYRQDNPRGRVYCMAFSPAGNYLAVGRKSIVELLELDELATRIKPGPLTNGRHEGTITGVAFSPDGSKLLTGSNDGTVRLWKVPSMEPYGPPLTGHIGRVLSVAFSSDGRIAASGGMDRRTILWDTGQTASQRRAEGGDGSFSMAFSSDGTLEAEGYSDESVLVTKHDRSRGVGVTFQLAKAASGGGPVSRVAFSPDNHYLASSTRDLTVRLYDTGRIPWPSGPPLVEEKTFRSEKFSRWSKPKNAEIAAVSLGGDLVAAAVNGDDAKAVVLIWNARTGDALFDPPLECPDDEVLALQLSADGKRIASGGDAEKMRVWDLTTGSRESFKDSLEVHTGKIRSIALDREGLVAATASGDNTLILWNAVNCSQLGAPLTGHKAPVISAIFSRDGKLLASGSDDTAVMLWDVESKQPAGRLVGHTGRVQALAFGLDGKQLFSGSWEQETRSWNLDPETLRRAARNRANRKMTENERRVYLETK